MRNTTSEQHVVPAQSTSSDAALLTFLGGLLFGYLIKPTAVIRNEEYHVDLAPRSRYSSPHTNRKPCCRPTPTEALERTITRTNLIIIPQTSQQSTDKKHRDRNAQRKKVRMHHQREANKINHLEEESDVGDEASEEDIGQSSNKLK